MSDTRPLVLFTGAAGFFGSAVVAALADRYAALALDRQPAACPADGRRIDEDAPLDDRFPYRASKIRTERLLRERHGTIPVVVLRAAGVYNERCRAAFSRTRLPASRSAAWRATSTPPTWPPGHRAKLACATICLRFIERFCQPLVGWLRLSS